MSNRLRQEVPPRGTQKMGESGPSYLPNRDTVQKLMINPREASRDFVPHTGNHRAPVANHRNIAGPNHFRSVSPRRGSLAPPPPSFPHPPYNAPSVYSHNTYDRGDPFYPPNIPPFSGAPNGPPPFGAYSHRSGFFHPPPRMDFPRQYPYGPPGPEMRPPTLPSTSYHSNISHNQHKGSTPSVGSHKPFYPPPPPPLAHASSFLGDHPPHLSSTSSSTPRNEVVDVSSSHTRRGRTDATIKPQYKTREGTLDKDKKDKEKKDKDQEKDKEKDRDKARSKHGGRGRGGKTKCEDTVSTRTHTLHTAHGGMDNNSIEQGGAPISQCSANMACGRDSAAQPSATMAMLATSMAQLTLSPDAISPRTITQPFSHTVPLHTSSHPAPSSSTIDGAHRPAERQSSSLSPTTVASPTGNASCQMSTTTTSFTIAANTTAPTTVSMSTADAVPSSTGVKPSDCSDDTSTPPTSIAVEQDKSPIVLTAPSLPCLPSLPLTSLPPTPALSPSEAHPALLPNLPANGSETTTSSLFGNKTHRKLVESPSVRAAYHAWQRDFSQLAKKNPELAFTEGLVAFHHAHGSIQWRYSLELGELARKHNKLMQAKCLYQTTLHLNPTAAQVWLELAKLEEECGNLEAALGVMVQGVYECDGDETLLIKTLKQYERLGNTTGARAILHMVMHLNLNKSWRVVVEGALMEARLGSDHTARRVFKFLKQHVSWYGPVYLEAARFEEVRQCLHAAYDYIEKGLTACPRYGPLWLALLRVYGKLAMQAVAQRERVLLICGSGSRQMCDMVTGSGANTSNGDNNSPGNGNGSGGHGSACSGAGTSGLSSSSSPFFPGTAYGNNPLGNLVHSGSQLNPGMYGHPHNHLSHSSMQSQYGYHSLTYTSTRRDPHISNSGGSGMGLGLSGGLNAAVGAAMSMSIGDLSERGNVQVGYGYKESEHRILSMNDYTEDDILYCDTFIADVVGCGTGLEHNWETKISQNDLDRVNSLCTVYPLDTVNPLYRDNAGVHTGWLCRSAIERNDSCFIEANDKTAALGYLLSPSTFYRDSVACLSSRLNDSYLTRLSPKYTQSAVSKPYLLSATPTGVVTFPPTQARTSSTLSSRYTAAANSYSYQDGPTHRCTCGASHAHMYPYEDVVVSPIQPPGTAHSHTSSGNGSNSGNGNNGSGNNGSNGNTPTTSTHVTNHPNVHNNTHATNPVKTHMPPVDSAVVHAASCPVSFRHCESNVWERLQLIGAHCYPYLPAPVLLRTHTGMQANAPLSGLATGSTGYTFTPSPLQLSTSCSSPASTALLSASAPLGSAPVLAHPALLRLPLFTPFSIANINAGALATTLTPSETLTQAFNRLDVVVARTLAQINQELVWKVHMERASYALVASDFPKARQAHAMAVNSCPTTLKWKVWVSGAKMEMQVALAALATLCRAMVLAVAAYYSDVARGVANDQPSGTKASSGGIGDATGSGAGRGKADNGRTGRNTTVQSQMHTKAHVTADSAAVSGTMKSTTAASAHASTSLSITAAAFVPGQSVASPSSASSFSSSAPAFTPQSLARTHTHTASSPSSASSPRPPHAYASQDRAISTLLSLPLPHLLALLERPLPHTLLRTLHTLLQQHMRASTASMHTAQLLLERAAASRPVKMAAVVLTEQAKLLELSGVLLHVWHTLDTRMRLIVRGYARVKLVAEENSDIVAGNTTVTSCSADTPSFGSTDTTTTTTITTSCIPIHAPEVGNGVSMEHIPVNRQGWVVFPFDACAHAAHAHTEGDSLANVGVVHTTHGQNTEQAKAQERSTTTSNSSTLFTLSPSNLLPSSSILARTRAHTRSLFEYTMSLPLSEWKVAVEAAHMELRCGNREQALRLTEQALGRFPGTGRLWALLIALRAEDGHAVQMATLHRAIRDTPKSGEVWCEAAKVFLDPTYEGFCPAMASKLLKFALHFTPQYGDTFVELIRCKLLRHGASEEHAELASLQQLCINTEPNYGYQWSQCRFSLPTATAAEIFTVAVSRIKAELVQYQQLYQEALLRATVLPAQHFDLGLVSLLNSPAARKASMAVRDQQRSRRERERAENGWNSPSKRINAGASMGAGLNVGTGIDTTNARVSNDPTARSPLKKRRAHGSGHVEANNHGSLAGDTSVHRSILRAGSPALSPWLRKSDKGRYEHGDADEKGSGNGSMQNVLSGVSIAIDKQLRAAGLDDTLNLTLSSSLLMSTEHEEVSAVTTVPAPEAVPSGNTCVLDTITSKDTGVDSSSPALTPAVAATSSLSIDDLTTPTSSATVSTPSILSDTATAHNVMSGDSMPTVADLHYDNYGTNLYCDDKFDGQVLGDGSGLGIDDEDEDAEEMCNDTDSADTSDEDLDMHISMIAEAVNASLLMTDAVNTSMFAEDVQSQSCIFGEDFHRDADNRNVSILHAPEDSNHPNHNLNTSVIAMGVDESALQDVADHSFFADEDVMNVSMSIRGSSLDVSLALDSLDADDAVAHSHGSNGARDPMDNTVGFLCTPIKPSLSSKRRASRTSAANTPAAGTTAGSNAITAATGTASATGGEVGMPTHAPVDDNGEDGATPISLDWTTRNCESGICTGDCGNSGCTQAMTYNTLSSPIYNNNHTLASGANVSISGYSAGTGTASLPTNGISVTTTAGIAGTMSSPVAARPSPFPRGSGSFVSPAALTPLPPQRCFTPQQPLQPHGYTASATSSTHVRTLIFTSPQVRRGGAVQADALGSGLGSNLPSLMSTPMDTSAPALINTASVALVGARPSRKRGRTTDIFDDITALFAELDPVHVASNSVVEEDAFPALFREMEKDVVANTAVQALGDDEDYYTSSFTAETETKVDVEAEASKKTEKSKAESVNNRAAWMTLSAAAWRLWHVHSHHRQRVPMLSWDASGDMNAFRRQAKEREKAAGASATYDKPITAASTQVVAYCDLVCPPAVMNSVLRMMQDMKLIVDDLYQQLFAADVSWW